MKWALAFGVSLFLGCRPHPPPSPVREATLGLAIERFELGNGLSVILVEDPRATQIQVTMRYRVGAIDDPPGQEGMAHLVEHLMFQQVLGGQSLFSQLENTASSFNGTTSLDATTYLSRANRDQLDKLLSIEAVRVGFRCTTITDATFEREREVVVNELRQRDQASTTFLAVQRGIYPVGHPYARSVGGDETSLRSITRAQACAFADAHYTTRNSVLVISGDLTKDRVVGGLHKFLGKLPARTAAPAVAVAAPPPRRVELPGPVDSSLVVVGWPLPADPMVRAQVRAMMWAVAGWIDGRVKGRVSPVELGDHASELAGVAIELGANETANDALAGVSAALGSAATELRAFELLGGVIYDRIRQAAVHRIFSDLEDGSDRDVRFAAEVLAGRDPRTLLAAQLAGLRALDGDSMLRIANSALQLDRASVLVMVPESTAPRAKAQLAPPVHDQGQRRDLPDPALARQPITGAPAPRGFAGMRTRELANGLTTVMLPITSVPTVDVRLVFRAGAVDDPPDASGAAQVAGYGLTWDLRHLNDLLLFYGAGGTVDVDVGTDHVEFRVRGMAMHLDALLAGLRRWVADGTYGAGTEAVAPTLRRALKDGERGALSGAWSAALYGTDHPYAKFGHALSANLAGRDGEQFRTCHLTPDNATLVIAGGFDPVLADRWLDFLFGSWGGRAIPRHDRRAEFRRVSLARAEPADQSLVKLAFPVTASSRAEQLVLAEILGIVVGEIRHQLGASYGVQAALADARLAPRFLVSGHIETRRLAEAMQLIRTQLDKLQDDPDEAARTFVDARRRVVTRLTSLSGRPSELCDQIVDDVAHDRAPLSALATALAVQQLTLTSINLYQLDVDAAAVSMQGPKEALDPAFGVLGRIPTYVTAPEQVAEPEPKRTQPLLLDRRPDDLDLPLTYQPPASPLGFTLGASYGAGAALDGDLDGYQLTGRLTYRFDRRTSFVGGLSLGGFSGSAVLVERMPAAPISVRPVGVSVGIQATFADRVWLGASLGLHADRVSANNASSWTTSGGVDLMLGVDLVELGGHRVAVFGRIDTAPLTDVSFSSFTAGLAYRRTRL